MTVTKEMIEALRKSLNGVAYISTAEATDAITAVLAAMPVPVVKAEYANRSTGGFTPSTDWNDVQTGYEQCPSCSGSGLQLNDAGEPDECRECKGNTVVPATDLQAENERLRAALEKLVKSANEVNRLGASTGPQWLTMTVAIVSARAAMERT